ncbi:hypothetical protein Sango_2472200, partial [Sesamum angolense]
MWRLTGFYGDADSSLRKLSWNTLRQLNDNSALPWVCGRNFNGILYSHEQKSRNLTPAWQVREFPAAISDANLADLGSGTKYAWCNNREEPHTVHSRLDRVFAYSKWRDVFPGSSANNIPSAYSDHYSLLLTTTRIASTGLRPRSKPFRFEAFWMRMEDCEKIIQKTWQQSKLQGQSEDCLEQEPV